MNRYSVEISHTAEKQLKSMEPEAQKRLVDAMRGLSEEPRPRGSRKLSGYSDVYRIRVGRFRILYSIESRRLVIIILKIGHRRDIYC